MAKDNIEGKISSKLLSLIILLLLLAAASFVFQVIHGKKTEIVYKSQPSPGMEKYTSHDVRERKLSKPDSKKSTFPARHKKESYKPAKSISKLPIKEEDISFSKNPIVLDKDVYQELLRNWVNLGKNEEGKGGICVSIRNLRRTYLFFGMKPVLIMGDNEKMYDLTDCSLIFKEELKGYSDIVFECSKPWKDWAESLRKIGVNKKARFKIYYYMFPHIKNSIFSRARQAFEYAKQKGLLDKETKPSQIEVQGDTLVIKKKGGGEFGIFIPKLILTANKKSIPVSLDWFCHEKEFRILSQNFK